MVHNLNNPFQLSHQCPKFGVHRRVSLLFHRLEKPLLLPKPRSPDKTIIPGIAPPSGVGMANHLRIGPLLWHPIPWRHGRKTTREGRNPFEGRHRLVRTLVMAPSPLGGTEKCTVLPSWAPPSPVPKKPVLVSRLGSISIGPHTGATPPPIADLLPPLIRHDGGLK